MEAWFEREYNARNAVPEHGRFFAEWKERGAMARAAAVAAGTADLDLHYGDGPSETLDLFRAPGGGKVLFVFIHGGYWRAMDKADFSWVAPAFNAAGIDVAMPNYALCPQVTIPQITDQMRRAVAWLARDPRTGGRPLVVGGHSAGGHLAGMLLATDWTTFGLRSDLIAGIIGLSGLYELWPLRHTTFNEVLRLDEAMARAESPMLLRPSHPAPALLAAGGLESEEFQRQTRDLAQLWAQCRPQTMIVPDTHHFSVMDCLGDAAHPLCQAATALCRSVAGASRQGGGQTAGAGQSSPVPNL